MTKTNQETLHFLELLPEEDQEFAYEFVKKLVLAWDSDFTKCTKEELLALEEAEEDITKGDVYTEEEVIKLLQ